MKNSYTRIGDKYLQLSELGSKYNLSFSSHLALGNRIIALDGVKKKLLVTEIENKVTRSYLVELDEVKAIALKKTYNSIKPGELNKKRLGEFLKTIYLQFEYNSGDKTIILPFYEREIDGVQDLFRVEKNAKNWHIILSKIASKQSSWLVKEKRQLQLAD